MINTSTLSPLQTSTHIAYSERPYRCEPGSDPPSSDIYLATAEERAVVVKAAFEAGVTFFHAAYEREAQSLGRSLRTLGIRHQVTLSTTDGDVLSRCLDTEKGAAQAIRAAIARKQELLGTDTIDTFLLYDYRSEAHTPARLIGAVQALQEAQSAGVIHSYGATCYSAYDTLALAIQDKSFCPDIVIARYNYWDQSAGRTLFPLCQSHSIKTLAAQTFSWIGDVPFVRFPNTWRYRNLTKNFYGFTAAQAHLHWVLRQPYINRVIVSMQTPEQVRENVSAAQITQTPQGLESLFESFVEAVTQTREGWRGLKQDELWEYRQAAEAYLGRGKKSNRDKAGPSIVDQAHPSSER